MQTLWHIKGDTGDGMGSRIERSTFIIDKEGVVRDVQYGIMPVNDANDVLNRVKALVV